MEIKKVGVVGAGTMGNGIAHVFAMGGYDVVLMDVEESFLDRALAMITKNLDRMIKKEKITEADKEATLSKITKTTKIEDMADCQIVVEAASEDYAIKQKIFKDLDSICGEGTILASNTSSISITEIAANTKCPEMVAGMPPGSVIVDLAAERGGNCALTRPGETVVEKGVTILGPLNIPAALPFHASQMYSKNISTFLLHMVKEGRLQPDTGDEIVRETMVCRDGEIVHAAILEAMQAGTPVLTSNVAAMPEVAGDAALLCDPTDTGAIADAIVRLEANASLRGKLIEKGYRRVESFRAHDKVRELLDRLESIV